MTVGAAMFLHVSHSFLFLKFTYGTMKIARHGHYVARAATTTSSQVYPKEVEKWSAFFTCVTYCHCQLLQLSSISDMWMNVEHLWNYNDGKAKVLGENPVSLLLCLPQIPRGVASDCTWACMVRGLWLTAWAKAQSEKQGETFLWMDLLLLTE